MLRKHVGAIGLFLLGLFVCGVRGGYGQSFSSGSTGSDGALNLTMPGVVLFDPKNPPLNPAGDNIFNFTTINIGTGVTLRLTGNILTGPVYFLASGAVQINGTIDLSGDNGHAGGSTLSNRIPAAPGAGGYGGGVGGECNTGCIFPPTPGRGPAGGGAGVCGNRGIGCGGGFTGSQFLIPLIGGSGGGGVYPAGGCGSGVLFGGGGGAGGGALLIASSVSITVNGTINANGGIQGCDAGAGAGGAVRLMSNIIAGAGLITARGENSCVGCSDSGADGRIRLEAFQQNYTGTFNSTPVSQSQPFNIVLPATPPSSVRVSSIAGIPINANPFSFPDAVINSSSPVPIIIEARYVPPGTIPKIVILSENVGDQLVTAPALQGTLQLSTTTVNVTLPAGGSRGYVRATW